MRSGLIFNVSAKFSNRYLLCRMVSASARKMHRDGVSTSQCINLSLEALHNADATGKSPAVPAEPEPQVSLEVEVESATVLTP